MKYLMHFQFKAGTKDETLASLYPAERIRIKELEEEGILDQFYMSHDLKQGWLVLRVSYDKEIEHIILSLPLHPFMNIQIYKLYTK